MDWSLILTKYLPLIARILLIVFASLGVVYMSGRLLFTKLQDKGKNNIAFFSLIFFAFLVNFVYSYPSLAVEGVSKLIWIKYLSDSLLYTTVSAVFYVVLGWRFYSRVDSYLDKKFGKDNKKKK